MWIHVFPKVFVQKWMQPKQPEFEIGPPIPRRYPLRHTQNQEDISEPIFVYQEKDYEM